MSSGSYKNNATYKLFVYKFNMHRSRMYKQYLAFNNQQGLIWHITEPINFIMHCERYWTSPGGNTPQGTNYTATYLPSRKLSKLDEPDMQGTAGEAGTSS